MNTKNNSRRRASVAAIERVFVELLQEKELEEISVSDICKRCGLNRSTFYANFADVYALADKIRADLERDVLELYARELNAPEHAGFGHDYVRLFYHMQDNQLVYRTYFKLGYEKTYNVTMYDRERAKEDFQDRYVDYHIAFFQSGFNAIVKLWLAGGCRETPEEMQEIIRSEYRGR